MTRLRIRARLGGALPVAALAAALMTAPDLALAQQGSGSFLDNLFNRGQQQQPAQQPAAPAQPRQPEVAQADANPNDVSVRIDRIEHALRQLTGVVEQLQHQNQMLQMQLKRMQDDTEYRFQQLGSRGGAPAPMAAPGAAPVSPPPANAAPGQRSDVFNPAAHPNAPGAPHALGNSQAIAVPAAPGNTAANGPPIGAPGASPAGAPLDLSTLAGNGPPPRGRRRPPPPPPRWGSRRARRLRRRKAHNCRHRRRATPTRPA